jgi:hypothetical protein
VIGAAEILEMVVKGGYHLSQALILTFVGRVSVLSQAGIHTMVFFASSLTSWCIV